MAAPLASWVRANVSYSRVLERITPLEQEQANLRRQVLYVNNTQISYLKINIVISVFLHSRNLQAAEDSMTRLATGLDDVDKQVAILRDQLSASTREASEIEIGLKKARETLGISQNLVLELADEYDRWRLQVIILFDKEEDVESRALLLSFQLLYLIILPLFIGSSKNWNAIITMWPFTLYWHLPS